MWFVFGAQTTSHQPTSHYPPINYPQTTNYHQPAIHPNHTSHNIDCCSWRSVCAEWVGGWLCVLLVCDTKSRNNARIQDSQEVLWGHLVGVGHYLLPTPARMKEFKIPQKSCRAILRELATVSYHLPQECKNARFPRSLVGQSSGSWELTMSVSRIIARRELHFRRNRFPTHTSHGVILREYSPRKHPKA